MNVCSQPQDICIVFIILFCVKVKLLSLNKLEQENCSSCNVLKVYLKINLTYIHRNFWTIQNAHEFTDNFTRHIHPKVSDYTNV